jgi:hypothetical protein
MMITTLDDNIRIIDKYTTTTTTTKENDMGVALWREVGSL